MVDPPIIQSIFELPETSSLEKTKNRSNNKANCASAQIKDTIITCRIPKSNNSVVDDPESEDMKR